MAKYMCITTCVVNEKSPDGKPFPHLYMEGEVIRANNPPNRHFQALEGEMQRATLEEVLERRLTDAGAYLDRETTPKQMQQMLAEKRAEENEKAEGDIMRKVLKANNVKCHWKLGVRKMAKLIREHNLADELKDAILEAK